MKKLLPINERPSIISGLHYAYPCAIIESNELCIMSVNDMESKPWTAVGDELEVVIEQNEIHVLKKDTSSDVHTFLWRKCEQIDEIILKIDEIKVHKKYVDLFIFEVETVDSAIDQNKYGVRWSLPGYIINGQQYDYDTYIYRYIKLYKKNRNIVLYGSINEIEWEYLNEIELPADFQNKDLKAGISIAFGKDRYLEWKYMNFIQLTYNYCNKYKGITLDYYMYPRKYYDNSFSFFGVFLNTYYESLSEGLEMFSSIHDLLHWNIRKRYYVNLCLNEYYVPGRENYKKQAYDHYNLFYGFDDNQKVYYVLGYDRTSKTTLSKIPYEIFDQPKLVTKEYVVRYKYEPACISDINFCIEPVIRQMKEYLYSLDSSIATANLIPGEKLKYGISVLKILAEREELGDVCRDLRISYMLKERYEIMLGRLKYLFEHNYIDDDVYDRLSLMISELINSSQVLMNMAIKGNFKRVEPYRISMQLMSIYTKEEDFCRSFLKVFKQS